MVDNIEMINDFSRHRTFLAFIGGIVVCVANVLAAPPEQPSTPTPEVAADSLATEVRRVITVDGVTRTYLAHIPASVDRSNETPVVLVLHGAGTNGPITVMFSGMNKKADAENFIAVYPDGTGAGIFLTWNAGGLSKSKVDDVKFLSAVIDDLALVAKIDPRRIFATGISNGGMMSYLLASELSDRIAAIAPIAGTVTTEKPTPSRSVPVMHFHGTADKIVPVAGPGSDTPKFITFKSVDESIKRWCGINGCAATPIVTQFPDTVDDGTTVKRFDYPAKVGGGDVVYIEISGGGHTWPGQRALVSFIGKSTKDISANDLMWEFFLAHPMPQKAEKSVAVVDSILPHLSKAKYAVAPRAELKLTSEKRTTELEVRVVYPSAPLSAQVPSVPWPLVVFSHGMGGSCETFEGLAQFLAARGYVVIRPTHGDSIKLRRQNGEDVSGFVRDPKSATKTVDIQGRVQECSLILDSLDLIEAQITGLHDAQGKGLIDRTRMVIAGHSAGAMTTELSVGAKAHGLDRTLVSLAKPIASIADPRFRAGVIVSGAGIKTRIFTEESWNEISVPILVITGSLDRSRASDEDPESRQSSFRYSRGTAKGGAPAWLMFIEGATHSSYSGKSKALALDKPDPTATDPELVEKITSEVIVRFLDAVVCGDVVSKEWLGSPAEIKALSQGKATIESK